MKSIFDKTQINSKEIQNRFLVAPMSRVSADLQGIPTREMLDYYTSFAKGGFGGIITEGIYTDEFYSRSYPNQPGLISEKQVQEWKRITAEVHKEQTLIIAQLMHAGSISQVLQKTKAPSKITPLGEKLSHYGGGSGKFPIPKEMTKADIENVIQGFSSSAYNAMKSGFDGVELHAANGYLLDQFITPYLNLRMDEYGGSIENRMKIISQIVERVRKLLPNDFILGLRISEGKVNNLKYRWEGGSNTARVILEEIKKMQIDYLHIAAEHHGWKEECMYSDGTSLTGLAKEIMDFPIVANGKLHELQLSKKILNTNQADLFAIGKLAISNPDFVNKLINKKDIVPFDGSLLYPNPSLFSDEKFEMFAKEFEKEIELNSAVGQKVNI